MSTEDGFNVPDQAIIDAILDYTRKHTDPCPLLYDVNASGIEKDRQEDRLVRWFQDTRFVLDYVCKRPGFSGLNVLKLAVAAMENEVISQSGSSVHPHRPDSKKE